MVWSVADDVKLTVPVWICCEDLEVELKSKVPDWMVWSVADDVKLTVPVWIC
jgi:hypothetical protein